jgi:hypothetical protein
MSFLSTAQADYSFAEWWILAQADWLIMMYPSAYSMTAAEVGFGTSGLPNVLAVLFVHSSPSCLQPECVMLLAPLAQTRSFLTALTGAMQRFDYVQSTFSRSQFAPECFGDAASVISDL